MARITAEQMPDSAMLWYGERELPNWRGAVAAVLNDPAIRGLLVEVVVGERTLEELDALADRLAFADIAEAKAILCAALCPATPPPETP